VATAINRVLMLVQAAVAPKASKATAAVDWEDASEVRVLPPPM